MTDLYLTTSIPYVNGAPHLGHALELVQVDALARHRAGTGAAVRVQSGTDDHAIKNVATAAAAGLPVADLVRRNGDRFADLAVALGVRCDEFLRTGSDPRHPAGVAELWRACERRGDLYRQHYTGLYCSGCERFYLPAELVGGSCGEHDAAALAPVTETNWFFRLSAYRDRVADLIRSGTVEVTPVERRNEVLGFLAGEVLDLSVSRPAARAGGWGVPVPGDPGQVVYVWFDALANYLTGLGYGTADDGGYRRWWAGPAERSHVIGTGIVRFHAVYWIAFLLSAGLPPPSRILVHDYLTVDGAKISKSGAQAADPAALVARYGQDALRWWLLREPARVGTTDFTVERLVDAYHRDLAHTIGNLASRTLTLAHRPAPWRSVRAEQVAGGPAGGGLVGRGLLEHASRLPDVVAAALARFDFRAACRAVVTLAAEANRFVGDEAPWRLAKAADGGDHQAAQRFEDVIRTTSAVCATLAEALDPFVPDGARRLREQLDSPGRRPVPVFPRR